MEDGFYEGLLKEARGIGSEAEFSGMDTFLADKVKISSMDDLFNFARISSDTLVHKAERDLWRIGEANGQMVIERLFDAADPSKPIKV